MVAARLWRGEPAREAQEAALGETGGGA